MGVVIIELCDGCDRLLGLGALDGSFRDTDTLTDEDSVTLDIITIGVSLSLL